MATDIGTVKRGRKPGKKGAGPAKEAKRATGARARVQKLPGMEDQKIPEVEEKAEYVNDCQTQRMEWQKKEAKGRTELLALMEQHGLKKYRYEDMVAEIEEGTKKVKVHKQQEQKGDE